nr:MAG TPA: hypothetical protein [Caudoviricetes sp.]
MYYLCIICVLLADFSPFFCILNVQFLYFYTNNKSGIEPLSMPLL